MRYIFKNICWFLLFSTILYGVFNSYFSEEANVRSKEKQRIEKNTEEEALEVRRLAREKEVEKTSGSKQALIDPDEVFTLDVWNDRGLKTPIFVEKKSWCEIETIPKKIPYVWVKISLTKKGLRDVEWERSDDPKFNLGDNVGKKGLFMDIKLPGTWPDPAKIKIYKKQK